MFKIKKIVYLFLLGISIVFIGLYWSNISNNVKTVLMSIGASLIGAIVLVFATDLISEKKIYNDRVILLSEAINAAKLVSEEIKNLVEELYDVDLPFGFSNFKDLRSQCDIFVAEHIKSNIESNDYLKVKNTLYETIYPILF